MPTISKPCHNCRRRRLRCDRSWPTCHKCAVSGQECLGYGRVFVWTQAIDGHGHPKPSAAAAASSSSGRNKGQQLLQHQHQPQNQQQHQPQLGDGGKNNNSGGWASPSPPPGAGGGAGGGDGAGAGAGAGSGGGQGLADRRHQHASHGHGFRHELPRHPQQGRDHDHDDARARQHRPRPRGPAMSAPPSFGPAVGSPQDDTHEPSSVPQPHHRRPSWIGSGRVALGNLTDPVFQDLDRNSRYYLAHCKCPFLWCCCWGSLRCPLHSTSLHPCPHLRLTDQRPPRALPRPS